MPICYCYNLPEGFEVREAFPNLEGEILVWRLMDIRTTPVVVCEYKEKPTGEILRRAIASYRGPE